MNMSHDVSHKYLSPLTSAIQIALFQATYSQIGGHHGHGITTVHGSHWGLFVRSVACYVWLVLRLLVSEWLGLCVLGVCSQKKNKPLCRACCMLVLRMRRMSLYTYMVSPQLLVGLRSACASDGSRLQ